MNLSRGPVCVVAWVCFFFAHSSSLATFPKPVTEEGKVENIPLPFHELIPSLVCVSVGSPNVAEGFYPCVCVQSIRADLSEMTRGELEFAFMDKTYGVLGEAQCLPDYMEIM